MLEWILAGVATLALVVAGVAVRAATRAAADRREGGEVRDRLDALDDTLAQRLLEDRRRVDELGRQVAELGGSLGRGVDSIDQRLGAFASMFSDHRARGAWGEVQLARVLDQAGLVEGLDYQTQATRGAGRVDVAITVGDRVVAIDAKFPVARLAEAAAAEGGERRRLLVEAARVVEVTAKALADKGYGAGVGDKVIMFVPNEGLLAQVMEADPGLHERVLGHGVLPVGPVGLAGLLGVIGALLVEQRVIERADAIAEDARDLVKRMSVWVGHLTKVGVSLGAAVGAYNQAVGSWQRRVEPKGRQVVEALGASVDIGLLVVEEAPRAAVEVVA
jgi:DNA recombination protein RmuC